MTQWNPIWLVEIDGVSYTNAILANLSITSGRRNIYEQAQAGYVNIQLLDVDQAIIPVAINSTIGVSVKDTSGAFVPIFGGNVVDIGLEIRDLGSTMFTQTYLITALGALARLPKIIREESLAQDFDGDQIYEVLQGVLLSQWQSVPGALTWATYDPTTTWANAGNTGLGQIDRPGEYELSAQNSDPIDVYSLVSGLATSGLGYIYEDAQGRISYASSSHRSIYLALNGFVDLDANYARGKGLQIQTRAGDVRNAVTISYTGGGGGGGGGGGDYTASDASSIALFGTLAQAITTTLHDSADAQAQAEFYLELRAYPQPIFSQITFDLTNPEIPNVQRDRLINIFMGEAIALTNLPLNMNAGTFQGFVEGWTFQASYNQLSLTLNVSPLAYSLQAMRWNQVPITETWASVSPTLDWQNATIVA